MAEIYLVRHGKAAAGFDSHPDPGLAPEGHAQAEAAAASLRPQLAVVTSTMARARETAAPLARRRGITPRPEPRIAEIPSASDDLNERAAWLRAAMAGRWDDLDPRYRRWRDDVVAAILDTREDTVMFSHFVAINVAFGAATGDDRLVCFRPDYCSITHLRTRGDGIDLVRAGREAETLVR